MSYVDCFVAPVREDELQRYLEVARQQGELWMRCGALGYAECVADEVPWGQTTSFPRSVRLADGEVVVLSWATYRSRAHRDEVVALAHSDPWHEQFEDGEMPFDTRRMYFGGFEQLIEFHAPQG